MVRYDVVRDDSDLTAILYLQQQNLIVNLGLQEQEREGFVTVEHSFELLKSMNQPDPHIIAYDQSMLVGYALVMKRQFSEHIPVLIPMFKKIDSMYYEDKPLRQFNYFVMGQICVAKPYRGKGVFRGLYNEMRDRMKDRFNCVITEVDIKNERSCHAHYNIGFKSLGRYKSSNTTWDLVLWNWR